MGSQDWHWNHRQHLKGYGWKMPQNATGTAWNWLELGYTTKTSSMNRVSIMQVEPISTQAPGQNEWISDGFFCPTRRTTGNWCFEELQFNFCHKSLWSYWCCHNLWNPNQKLSLRLLSSETPWAGTKVSPPRRPQTTSKSTSRNFIASQAPCHLCLLRKVFPHFSWLAIVHTSVYPQTPGHLPAREIAHTPKKTRNGKAPKKPFLSRIPSPFFGLQNVEMVP